MTAQHNALPAQAIQAAQETFPANPKLYGVDVAKAELVLANGGQITTIANQSRAVKAWLSQLKAPALIAMESTSTYHQLLADLAFAAGHRVFVLNPKQLKHYRTATQGRAKTDLCDAQLIARYLAKEHADLHPYRPLTKEGGRLSSLLRRRAAVVKAMTQLRLSLQPQAEALELEVELKNALEALSQIIQSIDVQIEKLLAHAQHQPRAARLLSIVGVGPLNAAALLVALERGDFPDADAFVAFLGLDPTPRDSGQCRGRRRLSKHGDSESRRLLFNAARSASLTSVWKPIYERYRKRGLGDVQTLCIIARKIARTAWSICKHGTTFCPKRLTQALT